MVRLSPCFTTRLAPVLLGIAWIGSAPDAVSGANIPTDQVEVVIERSAAPAYPGEMLLLKVHTTLFGKTVALEDLKQPALQNFAWIQLMPDHWSSTQVDGQQALRFERVLALFPTRSGSLTVDPFIHHLTLAEDNNLRRTIDLQSTPVEVDVDAWGPQQSGEDATDSWRLPAKSLTLTDRWEGDPERIPAGETARRTVIIEAVGLTAERLPPAPKLRSPGVITFAHPVDRQTLLTPAGPIARAVYSWDVRPATREAAALQGFHIPWFDTTTRRMREATLRARRIAFARLPGDRSLDTSPRTLGFPARFTWSLSALAAFIGGLAMVLVDRQREPRGAVMAAKLRTWGQMRSLRRAARSGDIHRFRVAVWELARDHPRRAREWLAAPPVRTALTELDLHLFGGSRREPPDLGAIAATIHRARLSLESGSVDPVARLDVSMPQPQTRKVQKNIPARANGPSLA